MKTTKTNMELKVFDQVAAEYLLKTGYLKDRKFVSDKAPTPIVAAIKIVHKQVGKILAEFNEEVENLRDMNCAVDPVTKAMIRNEKGIRQYTPEGNIKLRGEIKALLNSEVELENRIVEDYVDLTADEKEAFSDIVIPKQKINE